jgi:ABC-2 type transport system ATP-binding protein
MNDSDTLISVRRLGKTYGKRLWKEGFRALDEVDLDVGRGQVFGLLGPNGAGKTTLIKILMGLVPAWDGEATIFGEPAGKARLRERIGFLPEAHRLPGYLTGRQVLWLYGMYSGRERRWLDERIPGWLERVGMRESADRKVRQYSKGMQQRIGLVQALVHEPELVFLDEPTDGVDPIGRAVIRDIVTELRAKGVTVFINSHLLMEVEQVCDRVVIMARGRIVREGTIEEMTPYTGRVSFHVDPVPDDLETRLAGLGAELTISADGFEMNVSQADQDAVIDRLRSGGISIRSIAQGKLTLEQSFIDLIRRGEA